MPGRASSASSSRCFSVFLQRAWAELLGEPSHTSCSWAVVSWAVVSTQAGCGAWLLQRHLMRKAAGGGGGGGGGRGGGGGGGRGGGGGGGGGGLIGDASETRGGALAERGEARRFVGEPPSSAAPPPPVRLSGERRGESGTISRTISRPMSLAPPPVRAAAAALTARMVALRRSNWSSLSPGSATGALARRKDGPGRSRQSRG